MPTIHEVAKQAGVSASTVSRVMNGGSVAPQTAALVRDAARKLHFRPSRAARGLRTRTSEIIALVIPDIENPYFTSLARGVEDVARSAGYSVVLCNTDEDSNREREYLDIAISENMAGVIVAVAGDSSDLTDVIESRRPVVAVDRSPHDLNIDAVTVDNAGGGRLATEALIQQGYRRIACITGPRTVETAQVRADGWRRVMSEAGLGDGIDAYLRYADFRVAGGRDAMSDLLGLPDPPDAAFVANNLMSVGALQVLLQRGQTPPVVGLASFGDLPFLTLSHVGITVVHLPARNVGATAARLLLDRISGDAQPARTVILRNTIESGDMGIGQYS